MRRDFFDTTLFSLINNVKDVSRCDQIKQQILADYFRQNFSNDGQRFVAWYLRNVTLLSNGKCRAAIEPYL